MRTALRPKGRSFTARPQISWEGEGKKQRGMLPSSSCFYLFWCRLDLEFLHSEAHLAAEAASEARSGTFQLLLLAVELLLLLHQLIPLVAVRLLVVPLLGVALLLHHRLSHHLLLLDIPHLGLLRGLNQGLLPVRGETLLRGETLGLSIHHLPGLGLGIHHLLALALTKTVLGLLPHDADWG